MKRLITMTLALLTLALAACGSPAATDTQPAPAVNIGASGKPQLVEFYATW